MNRPTLLLASLLLIGPLNAHARSSTETAFSPSPKAIKLVEKTIAEADETIELAAYSFTSEKIADALVDAKARGVEVRILLDKGQGKRHYKALTTVYDAGIPIRINHHYNIMHDKYIVVDRKTVETGSFNFTKNAELHNAENVIVVRNKPELADHYLTDWQRLWDEAAEYPESPEDLITPTPKRKSRKQLETLN